MRVTLLDLKQSRIAPTLNIQPDDPRFTQYANEASSRIFFSGENFWGFTQRFQMCVHDNCITWPRRVAAIESLWNACGGPVTIRNQWFENLDSGPGLQGICRNNNSGFNGNWNGWWTWGASGMSSLDRGTACTFRDITGINKKIRVYADVAELSDAVILLQGYDENGIWIRTQVDGEWIDGEQVAISTTPTNSTKKFTSLVAVQKPQTNGNVRLYEYNVDTTTQRAIAVYEPSETNPVYRRSYIPGIKCAPCCDTDTEEQDACRRTKITAIARLEFVPAQHDSDWILPGNIPAMKDMMQAIRLYEQNNEQQAMICEGRCMNSLRTQLRHYLGHAIVQPVKMQSSLVSGPGGVISLI